jgi:putative ABC transport system substrate-binding protein
MSPVEILLAVLALGLLAALPAAQAQQPGKVYRLGIVASGVNPRFAPFFQAFELRLGELEWVDRQNLAIHFRTPTAPDKFHIVAAELIGQKADVILAPGPEAALKAARQATNTIPIVMVALNYDPIERRYVTSLARPGGNITGTFSQALEQGAKQLELLKEMLPKVTRVGVIWDAFSKDQLPLIDAGASQAHVLLEKIEIRPPYDFERAILTLKQRRVGALLVVASPVSFRERTRIAALALKHRLPAGGFLAGAEDGFVLGFGVHPSDLHRRAADFGDKILRGAKPGDLPVEQVTKFSLVVNLKTAKALGLTIPQSVLIRADEVIR